MFLLLWSLAGVFRFWGGLRYQDEIFSSVDFV